MRFQYLIHALLFATVVLGQTTQCTKPRVRRAWSQMPAADKALYIEAVALGMQRGYHHKFVEIHMEPSSEREAHGCLFFYWHRAFLLAYENMLRSLGNKFACVTIPFWDYGPLGASFIAGSCKNMLDCGTLLRDFGSSLPTGSKGPLMLTANGMRFQTDNCVTSAMTKNFCQSSTAYNSNKCYNCMPRNDWSKVEVPPDVNVLNVYNNILGDVPATLDGVTSGVHPPANKGRDPRTWSSCRNYVGRTILPSDTITMKVGETGARTTSVWSSTSSVASFFKGLPQKYPDYADTTKLGANSYSYDFTGTTLNSMNKQCSKFRPTAAASFLTAPADTSVNSTDVTKEISWLNQATALASKYYTESRDVNHQVQLMLCVYYNECLGGVFDYSDEFKANFRATTQPPCKRMIDELASGDATIGVIGWEQVMLKNYPCNTPSSVF
uniref:Secreted protein n=1 Tax=Achlya hypogyna TaxID=1202772 RepID=A0A0A7CPF4_ACHHY|nr:secreted protein [Achlya hypogyna]